MIHVVPLVTGAFGKLPDCTSCRIHVQHLDVSLSGGIEDYSTAHPR
jgi:hypothetical protein